MYYKKFVINNFKGIESIDLDFKGNPAGRAFCLVGLNESGKTTLLEAVNFFNRSGDNLDELYEDGFPSPDEEDLIPIDKRSNFNDSVEVVCTLVLDDKDVLKIKDFARRKLGLEVQTIEREFEIYKTIEFKNSKKETVGDNWGLEFTAKKKRGKKTKKYVTGADWNSVADFIETGLPPILYFPTFLFDFPEKIYLNGAKSDEGLNKYYKIIVQDILDALDEGLRIETHVVGRAVSDSARERSHLRAVLVKMGAKITQIVVKAWNRILSGGTQGIFQDIRIDFDVETEYEDSVAEKNGVKQNVRNPVKVVFLQFRLQDGASQYLVTERSLGFRWFFCFLLFTQFRALRRNQSKALFLFDEPASNLHSRAQKQLLTSFEGILSGGSSIIYTTHSQHMINPHWLEDTYIVRNSALNYDESDFYDYATRTTKVVATRYADFVNKYPSKITYFQPILDHIMYQPSDFELVPDVLFVEGKSDFYALKLLSQASAGVAPINIIPAFGASTLEVLASLYLGWGRRFLVLLDGDKEGVKQKIRYESLFPWAANRFVTLGDLDKKWEGAELEKLFDVADQRALVDYEFPKESITKKSLNESIRISLAKARTVSLSDKTRENFELLLARAAKRIC